MLISSAISLALFFSSSGIANAENISEPDATDIAKIADEAKVAAGILDPSKELIPRSNDSKLSFIAPSGVTEVEVTEKGLEIAPLTFGDSSSLFTLNELNSSEELTVLSDGSTVISGDEQHHIVDSYQDGSLRIQTVIESEVSDHAINFEIGLQDDEIARVEPDGSVGIYRVFEGEDTALLTSVIEKPWAADVEGKSVNTRFELENNSLVQIVEPASDTVYPVTADPFWIPAIIAGIRVGVQVLIKVGPRVVKYGVAPASRVTNALKSFSAITFRAGSNVVKLDKAGMKHILQHHHPQYWNGAQKGVQTFFNPKMSVSDVRNVIHGAMKNHSLAIRSLGSGRGSYTGTYDGVKYKMVIDNGRVVQFYPR